MKKLKNNNKGITLIALVITIIVLLILAGVSIAMLTGDNGILTQANNAKEQTEYKEAREKVQIAVMGSKADDGAMKIEELIREVGYQGGTVSGSAFPVEVTMDGYTFTVDANGNVEKSEQKLVISNIEVKKEDGSDIPAEGVNEGIKLKINFTATIKDGKIESITPNVPYTTNGTEKEVTFEIVGIVDGKKYTTTKKISIADKYKKAEEIGAVDIQKAPQLYYGATVTGYTCTNSAGVNAWKIFYADANNIYLIADDYIKYDYCPPSATQKIYKNSDYKLSMNNVIKDYTGSANITDSKIKALNNSYFEQNFTSTNDNMKAVAYMLDTNVWSVFKDNNKAEYAVGGPTVEMLMKSYSQKYNVDYQAKATSETGYKISKDGGANWATNYPGMLSKSDSLYVISLNQKANAMWLASPAAIHISNVMDVYSNNDMSSNDCNYTFPGFRPLVCLKSDVKLENQLDGTYKIK